MNFLLDKKSLQYVSRLKDFNFHQQSLLELLNDYDMSVFKHPDKPNFMEDALIDCLWVVWLM